MKICSQVHGQLTDKRNLHSPKERGQSGAPASARYPQAPEACMIYVQQILFCFKKPVQGDNNVILWLRGGVFMWLCGN